jgi:hypothetical protein
MGPYEYVFTDEPAALKDLTPLPENQDAVQEPEKAGSRTPLPENRNAAEPLPENREADLREKNINQKRRRKKEKQYAPDLVDGGGPALPLFGTDGFCNAVTEKRRADAQAEVAVCSAMVASGDRVPFSTDVLREVGALGLDVEALVERYRRKTRGKQIDDPSAYLLQMARTEAAKARGATPDTVSRIGKSARAERIKAAAAEVAARAVSEPTERAVRAVTRSARQRGQDPAGLIEAWRQSVASRGFPSRAAADRSLHAFAVSRFFAPNGALA